MADWWNGFSNERYWCEVTDRGDIGSDLKAPQRDEAGQDYWSYSLIRNVLSGDVVFHYSTRLRAFIGASVAGGPMEERPIFWAPHGTVARARDSERQDRPGYWRPLYGYRPASSPLSLSALEQSGEAQWLRNWVDARRDAAPLRLPFQLRTDGLRAGQGYLFKMPADFVERWATLRELADALDDRAQELSSGAPVETTSDDPTALFRPKSEADYTAFISAAVQHRTRTHEKLLRLAGEWLQAHGVTIANPHPKDLVIISPVSVIVEAKVTRQRDPLYAAREAVGQLHEYRYFIGPRDAALAILLDAEPPCSLIEYLEGHLQVAVLWLIGTTLTGGPLAKILILNLASELHRRTIASPGSAAASAIE
jgi:hypothetical protein